MEKREIVEPLLLRDQITDHIRQMILLGELKPGEKLSERKLGSFFGVSTTPIKEALRCLQTEKLVISKTRSGTYVSEHSRENIKTLLYLRSVIDGLAAYYAANNATAEQIREMSDKLKTARSIIESGGDIKYLTEANDAFHALIRESSNNPYLCDIANSFVSIDATMRRTINEKESTEVLIKKQEEHEAIYQLIFNRDCVAAEEKMRDHIRETADSILIN